MNRTFIWGHRGAGFRGVDNTITSFQKAIEMGVDGIETDANISNDGIIILIHDYTVELDGKKIEVNKLSFEEIKQIKLENNESIPSLSEVFNVFKSYDIRYSIDIRSTKVGLGIIDLAKKYHVLNKVELCDDRFNNISKFNAFSKLREKEENITLINTISATNKTITEKLLKIEKMKEIKIQGFNVNHNKANSKLFKIINDAGFSFYVWGVQTRKVMKKMLNMKYNNNYIDAIYTDYPDKLIELREKIQREYNL